jgi:4-hydroxy-2-oxoheptanedioate aldolase
MKRPRSLLDRLAGQRAILGLLQSHPNPALAEMAGMCGYDFLFLDGEHGVFSEMDHLNTLRALAATDVLAMIRLAKHDTRALGRYLDMGVDAIVVPNVTTAEQARTLVSAMHYPPAGIRGMGAGAHRVTRYGLDLGAYLKSPREGTSLIVIIESALGVANAEDILAVEGVDGAIIGPADLSADLGCTGDFSRPVYTEAIIYIERAAATQGKLLGTAPHPGYSLEALLARGHRMFIIGADMPLICEAMSAQVARARASL